MIIHEKFKPNNNKKTEYHQTQINIFLKYDRQMVFIGKVDKKAIRILADNRQETEQITQKEI